MNENYGKFMDVGGVESVTNETGNYNDILRELVVVIKQHVARLDGELVAIKLNLPMQYH